MIRPARLADLPQLCAMIHALAAHHHDSASVTEAQLARDLFGPAPWLQALVAEGAQGLQGYAVLTQLARLQYGQRGLDLHHLYICTEARGLGIGKALVAACLDLARRLQADYLTVSALSENPAAQQFYLSQGFTPAPFHGVRFGYDLRAKS